MLLYLLALIAIEVSHSNNNKNNKSTVNGHRPHKNYSVFFFCRSSKALTLTISICRYVCHIVCLFFVSATLSLFQSLYVYLLVCLSNPLTVCLFFSGFPSVCLSRFQSVIMSVCLSVHPSLSLSVRIEIVTGAASVLFCIFAALGVFFSYRACSFNCRVLLLLFLLLIGHVLILVVVSFCSRSCSLTLFFF